MALNPNSPALICTPGTNNDDLLERGARVIVYLYNLTFFATDFNNDCRAFAGEKCVV